MGCTGYQFYQIAVHGCKQVWPYLEESGTSPNFNYQPMLPDNSVPSTDKVEAACTLVQIGDSVAPYLLDTDVLNTPLFEGPEVSPSNDAMDKIVGKLDVCMWKPGTCLDAMDQIISSTENMCVNVETKSQSKPKLIVKVETKRCTVKLVRLDSILFEELSENSASVLEETSTNPQN